MVTAVKDPSLSPRAVPQPRFVELTGLAGSGKSTLARALCRRSGEFAIGTEIAFRQVKQIAVLLESIPVVLSSLFLRARGDRLWTWDEIKFLIYVKKWDRVLKQQAQSHPGTILLDHGPIFKLATLHAFGPGWLRSDAADAWWQELFQRWAALLDLVIWLDAPDDLLETRINARAQKHPVKGRSGQEVTRFLEAYRSSYQYVLSKLAASGRPDIVRFDTGQAAMEQVTDEALATCQREAAGS